MVKEDIFKNIRKQPDKHNLRMRYKEMIRNLLCNIRSIVLFIDLFRLIFETVAETKGELMIQNKGEKVCFARNGTALTDFGIIVLEVVHKRLVEESQDWVRLFVLGQGNPPKIIQIRSAELGSGRWLENLGAGYIYERQEVWTIRTLIQIMAKYATEKDEFLYSGWISDKNDSYVFCGQKICAADWNADRAKVSCEYMFDMLGVASHSITIPLLAIVLLSLVHSWIVKKGTFFKGICCLEAPTQSYKTTLAALFFDFENGTEVDLNFESTQVAISRTIGCSRDTTVVVDDYKPGATKAERNEMEVKISKVIRMCSDDSGGIKKAGIQNSVVADRAQCMVVVTAEQIQFKVQSTLARLLILAMDRKSVDRDKLTCFQKNHDKYREFIKCFIQYIGKLGVKEYCDDLMEKFIQNRDGLRKLFDKDADADNRTNDMCVWLYVSYNNFLKYARHINILNEEQAKEFCEEARGIFLSIMEQQAERVAELNDVKRFFKGLQVLVESKEVYLGTLQARNNCYSTKDSKTAIGFLKKGFVYLKNNVAFQKVVSYFQYCGQEFVTSESALRRALASSGYINPKDEKTYIHRLGINHETYQCVQFNEQKFYELLKGGKGNGRDNEKERPSDWGMRQNADNILGRRDGIVERDFL